MPQKYFWSFTKIFWEMECPKYEQNTFFPSSDKNQNKSSDENVKHRNQILKLFRAIFVSKSCSDLYHFSLMEKNGLFSRWFLKFHIQEKKWKNLAAMFYVFIRTFVLIFFRWWKNSILSICETFLKKFFVKDQKHFKGTCCFSISKNLHTIHLTYEENRLVKTVVFLGHLL